mmetsp:Transcript_26622/g.66902  ORF Transcript_26622/g.66902 Transcript_26622/m.66902 type:complete len:605 (+) Transcript_26622:2725-4539(+)
MQDKVVGNALSGVQEATCRLRSVLHPDHVNQTTATAAKRTFVQVAAQQGALLDQHPTVAEGHQFTLLTVLQHTGGALHVHVGQNQREHLLAGPELTRLEDGRLRDAAVKVGQPHQDVHHDVALQEGVLARHQRGGEQGILHHTDHRFVRLRTDDLPRDHHQLADLGARLQRLRHVHVHLVTVKIGVVRRGDREVETEGRVGHDLHAMSHHTHLVKRRLPVEDDEITVLDVALDSVAVLEVEIAGLGHPEEVLALAVVAHDEARTRVLVGAVADQLVHAVDVERRHDLRVGEVDGDRARYTNLVDADVGIGRDDRTRREIHTFSHEVAANSTFLAAQTLPDALQHTAALLCGGTVAGDLRIDHGRAVVLQNLGVLGDHVRRGTVQLVLAKRLIGLHDVGELVCEIILSAQQAVHHDGRPSRTRRHRQHRQDHPVGTCPLWIEAKQTTVIVTDATQPLVHLLGSEHTTLLHSAVVHLRKLADDAHTVLDDLGLDTTTATFALDSVLGLSWITDVLGTTHSKHRFETMFRTLDLESSLKSMISRVTTQFRAVEANATKNCNHIRNEANMIHGFGQLNVTKVTWTLAHITRTGSTFLMQFRGAHPRIL